MACCTMFILLPSFADFRYGPGELSPGRSTVREVREFVPGY